MHSLENQSCALFNSTIIVDIDLKIVEIKGPESWWIAKSITISRVVNQSKVNPQRPKVY